MNLPRDAATGRCSHITVTTRCVLRFDPGLPRMLASQAEQGDFMV